MRSSKCLITFIALGLLSAGTVFGSGLVFGAGSIQFPNKVAQAGDFRVSGPDNFSVSRSFEAGESLSFSLYDADGFALPDGIYKWSIEIRGKAAGGERGLSPQVEPVTGTFSIRNGEFVNPNLIEALPNKDQVINDDLIVTNSACVGQDCVNGESFGFDTLRLKENNLRIKAQDTSTSASFPTVDWQITFNDSTNGGLNKFSIDNIDGGRTPFTIEHGAATNALYVEADSDVGLGTKDPVVDLHIKKGDTPTLRLEQDGTSGFTPQTFDIAANEANFFVRDVTNGSRLVFKIKPGAPTSSIFVAASGNIGLGGTESPSAPLHILQSGSSFSALNGTTMLLQSNATVNDGVIMSLISGSDQSSQVSFGESSSQFASRIIADNLTDTMTFQVGGTNGLVIDASGNVTIGGTCGDALGGDGGVDGCDRVFHPDYPLPTIEEHAAQMWENSYLPAVGPTPDGSRIDFNVFQKTTGILNELEKAHIFIEQLNNQVKELQQRLEELESQD